MTIFVYYSRGSFGGLYRVHCNQEKRAFGSRSSGFSASWVPGLLEQSLEEDPSRLTIVSPPHSPFKGPELEEIIPPLDEGGLLPGVATTELVLEEPP